MRQLGIQTSMDTMFVSSENKHLFFFKGGIRKKIKEKNIQLQFEK